MRKMMSSSRRKYVSFLWRATTISRAVAFTTMFTNHSSYSITCCMRGMYRFLYSVFQCSLVSVMQWSPREYLCIESQTCRDKPQITFSWLQVKRSSCLNHVSFPLDRQRKLCHRMHAPVVCVSEGNLKWVIASKTCLNYHFGIKTKWN